MDKTETKDEFKGSTQILTNIKSNTKFVFRVRVVFNEGGEGDGPYSEESEEVKTLRSPASDFVDPKMRLEDSSTSPFRYALPLSEIQEARNTIAKTRKFMIGKPNETSVTEKTILLIGETGSGKSTMVNGLANYKYGVKWDDPFRFDMIHLEQEERDRNQADSQTQWITCYTLNNTEGSRIPYTLNIIDTPGLGDTRGFLRDKEIVDQMRQLFSQRQPKGIVTVDAVCVLLKAQDARLTLTQKYVFQSLMEMFGKNIEENICSLISFADDTDPKVLAAMKESRLPFGKHFKFNNSALFADNDSQMGINSKFWDIGLLNFRDFFNHIDTLSTQSLQLTSAVLEERKRIDMEYLNTVKYLQMALHKLNELNTEKKKIEDNRDIIKANIEANADFTYEVQTIQQIKRELPPGIHVTNCLNCDFTCIYANNEQKIKCSAMKDGYCTICPDKCSWEKHSNSKHEFSYKTVKETKSYAEKKKKYEEEIGKKLTLDNVLEKISQDVVLMEDSITGVIQRVKIGRARLDEIAMLPPNPLSMVQYIDLSIKNEESQHKDGYLDRIESLKLCRKRVEFLGQIQNDTDDHTAIKRFRAFFGFSVLE